MNTKYQATISEHINVPASKVWEALVNPEIVKQYFFGVELITDWKKGSSIIYKGVWEGKTFEDKGTVLEIILEQLLITSYWSSFSGLPDSPENYQIVTYNLEPMADGTKLTVTQSNIRSEEAKNHSQENWKTVLGAMKKLLEI